MGYSDFEDAAMRRALDLARRGPRGVNPQVGAVLLSPEGEVLAEGWHRGVSTAHAEVDALSKLAPGAARGATAVVTLEPCNHTGNTGPCSVALIEAGVARVVYAIDDPGRESGGGAQRLRQAGVEIVSGLRCDEAEDLLDSWLTVQRLGRPFVTVKWAQSLDGRAAAADGTSQWITGPDARVSVGYERARADAIVVGTGTVLADDPALTARDHEGALLPDQPVPVVIGSREVPMDAAIRRHPHPPLFFPDPRTALDELRARGMHRVFVEGGPTLASAFIGAGLFDECLVFIAPVILGGGRLAIGDVGVGTLSEAWRLERGGVMSFDGGDILVVATPRVHSREPDVHSREPDVHSREALDGGGD